MCGVRRANIYVGLTPEDFLDDEALICQRDITVNQANYEYIDECRQPIFGRYFTLRNYANVEFDQFAQKIHGIRQCLNLCEVDVYVQGKGLLY